MEHSLANPGPKRFLILCSRNKFDRYAEDDEYFIRAAVDFASGNFSNVFHIGTRKSWRRVSILFDYNNPDHRDSDVLAFRVKKKPFYIYLKPEMVMAVHRQAGRWIDDHKSGCILPIRTELKPDPNLSDPYDLSSLRKPPNAATSPLFTSTDVVDSKRSEPLVEDDSEGV